jgi:hypothetical protein
MEQIIIIRFLTRQGCEVKTIQVERDSGDGTNARDSTAVKTGPKRFPQERTDIFDGPTSKRASTHTFDEAGISMLFEGSFSSCRVVCCHLSDRLQQLEVATIPSSLGSVQPFPEPTE